MEPLAKPSGITLCDHRRHVLAEAERLLGLRPDEASGLPFPVKKYAEIVPGGDLNARVRRAAWFHDEGKKHECWQTACRADYKLYQAWRRKQGLDPNAVDPDDWDRYYRERRGKTGPRLMKAGLRHEIASLGMCRSHDLSLAERVAIGAHHGKLGARHEHRWLEDADGEFADLWGDFQRESVRAARSFRRDHEAPLLHRYELAGPRALLRLADTRASRAEAGNDLVLIEPFSYVFNEAWTPRPVQKLALEHAEDWITILRAPTGSGKTDAAFLWAQRQVELSRADRLVVAMPTRFTSNALALGNAESLSQTGLYHSSAWHARYGDRELRTPDYDMAKEEHKLARLLATPITVCTIDHLLIVLTGSREDHHATFFFLANSAVVFDEVDFYDPFVQANLVVLLRALRTLNVPVLLMSATVPESACVLYGVETDIRETEESTSGRRILQQHPTPNEKPEDAADVLGQMIEEEVGIVYANTVERAYRTYCWLRDEANNPNDVPVYLYHSRFTEPDKKQIETALIGTEGTFGALGIKAWKAGKARGIAVLTQIGEMSINVSAPLMLSDLCPWDRLAQRAGRLARFSDYIPEGELFVAEPQRDGELYPAPYGSFEQGKGWAAGDALLETQKRFRVLLDEGDGEIELTPALLVDEVNKLYPDVPEPNADAAANVGKLEGLIRRNWMIVQAAEASEEDGGISGDWRSRDIPPQETVLVHLPDDLPESGPYRFETYEDAQGFLLDWTVECPAYLIRRGVKREVMYPFTYVVGYDDCDEVVIHFCTEYDAPKAGQGGGLGALATRDREDTPPATDEDW